MNRLKKFLEFELSFAILGFLAFVPGIITEYLEYTTIAYILYALALIVSGWRVFWDAVKGILRKDFLDEKFLMSIASVGALVIGEGAEGVAVMLFFIVGEFFEHKAIRKSRNSIKELMKIRPDTATVLNGEAEEEVDAEDVDVGSVIVIKAGERIPIDSVVISGDALVDNSALTGESIPVSIAPDSEISSGGIVLDGVIYAKTLKNADESCASRILELVENASENKAKEEAFITKFSRVYTPIVTFLALVMAVAFPIAFDISVKDSIYRALSFLVVSCPCALVISVPLAFFGGIGGAASKGILYKGGNYFSPLTRAKRIVFDKTGTLTTGSFEIKSIAASGIEEDELLKYASSLEQYSNHPIAGCIASASEEKFICEDIKEHAGKGITAIINGRAVAVGNSSLMRSLSISVPEETDPGTVFVSMDGEYKGLIRVSDKIRLEVKDTLSKLREIGVEEICLLSGDTRKSVNDTVADLDLDKVEGELLPEDKYESLKKLKAKDNKGTIYVGDGINDAPCLAFADVGIAMGGIGSDSALEAADLIIMSDNLSRIPEAIKISKKTLRIAKENIVFAIGVKLLVLLLVSLNIANMWMAVFADVGVAVIAILNSMRTLLVRRK